MDRSVIVAGVLVLAVLHIASSNVLLPYGHDENLSEYKTAQNSSDDTYPAYVGFITAGVAVITYGSNFIPVKQFDTGDGMFFQFVLCCGVFLPGIILQIWRKSTFYPLVMVGGAIWTTGNVCVVPIIKTIGMGLGLCIWGMFNLLAGWANGRFGWFGIKPEVPEHQVMNYIGVALAAFSSVIYTFVKSEVSVANVEMIINVDEDDPLIDKTDVYGSNPQEDVLVFNKRSRSSSAASNPGNGMTPASDHSFINNLTPTQKRIVGVGLSVFSGLLYGSSFAPAIHCIDNYGGSQNALDYVFAHYCGIFFTSSIYFFIYIIVKKNRPDVYPQVILPAVISGAMWGVATACWFVANKALSEPVSFPIVSTVPGAIASLFWGVVIFREIKGLRNILILLFAFSVTTTGAILAGLSH